MTEDKKTQAWPQPYDFGQGQPYSDAPASTPASAPDAGTAEAADSQYDTVSNQGTPDNPGSAREVVERGAVNVANRHATPSPGKQQRLDATAGVDRDIRTIRDWMDSEEHRPESDEDRRKRERREKSKRIIAAVSDGLSALGNLFFTTRYAPNMYNHDKGSMSAAVGKRIDQLKADRDREHDKYLNYSLRLGDLENQRAAILRELEAQQEQQRLARERERREAEKHGWLAAMQPDKLREQKGKADKTEQEAITAQAVAKNAAAMQKAKLATEKSRKGKLDASATKSRSGGGGSKGGVTSTWYATDENGNVHSFQAKNGPHAHNVAGANNWTLIGSTTTTESTEHGRTRTSTRKTTTEHPAKAKKKTNVKWK